MTALLVAAALLAGCGDDGASGEADAGADAGARVDAGTPDAGAGVDAGSDAGGLTREDCTATWVEQTEGTIVDEAGDPVAGARPQACLRTAPDDILVCLSPPMSAADGTYTIPISGDERCVNRVSMRVLLPASTLGTTYCHVDASAAADGVLALAEPTVLYATAPAVTLPPLGDETMARTVVLDDGLEIDVVPSQLGFEVEYAELRGRRVPFTAGAEPCFARGLPGLSGLYVFGDEGSIDGGTFALRIPNTTGLPAGSAVELRILGGLETYLADETPVEEADFVAFGTATVSADGSRIVAAMDSGLPHFTWLGYRPLP